MVLGLLTVRNERELVHGKLDKLDDKDYHMGDLLVKDVYSLHGNVCVKLVAFHVDDCFKFNFVYFR